MNSFTWMPRQNESKVRNLCPFGLVFGKKNKLNTSKIAWHMDKGVASLEQVADLYLSSMFLQNATFGK